MPDLTVNTKSFFGEPLPDIEVRLNVINSEFDFNQRLDSDNVDNIFLNFGETVKKTDAQGKVVFSNLISSSGLSQHSRYAVTFCSEDGILTQTYIFRMTDADAELAHLIEAQGSVILPSENGITAGQAETLIKSIVNKEYIYRFLTSILKEHTNVSISFSFDPNLYL